MVQKLVSTFVLMVCFFTLGMQLCDAAQAPRTAILPVFSQRDKLDKDIEKIIADALAEKFRMPLSNELIPASELALALPPQPTGGKRTGIERGMLREVADKLNADIVIAAEVTDYHADTWLLGNGERMQRTEIAIKLISYHRPSGSFIEKKEHEEYFGDYMTWKTSEYLAKELITTLLKGVPDYLSN